MVRKRTQAEKAKKAARSVSWNINFGRTCMKHEATGASLQSVKFKSCLSSRQGDINLKSVFIITEGMKKKEHGGSTAFFKALLR